MLRWLDDDGCTDVATAGGKGASLALLTALGIPVPPGFVVPAGALCEALEAAGALAALRRLLADAGEESRRPAVAQEACATVRAAPVPETLADELREAYGRLGDGVPVAVRSSACGEDSETASFAGPQETYLHVRGAGAVIEKVRACWCSFFTERALFYRAAKGSLEDLDIAVVVQRMVEPDVAGVMFTVDPARGRWDRIVVEAVFGLGESVVSGELTPDHYVLSRRGELKRSRLQTQPFAVVHDDGGGTRRVPLAPAAGEAPTLDEAALRRLAALGVELEERLGGPQDVEWAIRDGELFVLQARPVTA